MMTTKFERLHDDDAAAATAQSAGDAEGPSDGDAGETKKRKMRAWCGSHPDVEGLGLNIVAQFLFSLMTLLIKLAGSFLGSFELVFVRSLVQLVWGVTWMFFSARGVNPFGPFKDRAVMLLLFTRATVGIMSMSCWFWSIRLLPLAEATLVNFFSPVWTAVFGFILLKEKISWLEMAGMGFSAVGILLVARPPFLLAWFGMEEGNALVSSAASSALFFFFSSSASFSSAPTSMSPATTRLIGVLVGVAGTVCAGMAYVLTRKIGKRVESSVVVNWLSLAGCVYTPLPAVFFEGFVIPKGTQWLYVVAIGTVAFGAQTFFTKALQKGLAARVVVANYTTIIWAFLWGILILHETPVWLSLVGTVLILVNAGIAVFKAFRVKPKAAAVPSTAEVPYLSVTPRQSTEKQHALVEHESSVELEETAGIPDQSKVDESRVPMLSSSAATEAAAEKDEEDRTSSDQMR